MFSAYTTACQRSPKQIGRRFLSVRGRAGIRLGFSDIFSLCFFRYKEFLTIYASHVYLLLVSTFLISFAYIFGHAGRSMHHICSPCLVISTYLQTWKKPCLLCYTFSERVHDEGVVASRKPKPGCTSGGRYPEEKDGGSKAYGYGARTGKRTRAGPPIKNRYRVIHMI